MQIERDRHGKRFTTSTIKCSTVQNWGTDRTVIKFTAQGPEEDVRTRYSVCLTPQELASIVAYARSCGFEV